MLHLVFKIMLNQQPQIRILQEGLDQLEDCLPFSKMHNYYYLVTLNDFGTFPDL